MPENDDDRGQKPEHFCENIWSGFKACGTADVEKHSESSKIKKNAEFSGSS